MSAVWYVRAALFVLAGLGGCHCTPSFGECAPIEPPLLAAVPRSLAGTGLRDPATGELAGGVRPYTPRFELWTDGAEKRRWVLLPPGTQIDASDMDAWRFPVGTRFWKQFTRDGVVVETRFLLKHGEAADAWTPMAYLHGPDGDAQAAPQGVSDAGGTKHDVPDAASCRGCHGGVASGVLGFSAVQLPWAGTDGELGLEDLVAQRALTHAPAVPATVPGDETTVAALGYLHANCSHCHNQARPARSGPRCFDPESPLDLTLRVGDLQHLESTAAYRTAVGSFIQPGEPADSEVIVRARSRDRWWGMPALGTEQVDAAGVALLERWIEQLR